MFLAETTAGVNILNGWLKNLGDYTLHSVLPALFLFVVGAAHEGKLQGCIVNSLHQVTAINPFQFTLTVNKSSETFKASRARAALPLPS